MTSGGCLVARWVFGRDSPAAEVGFIGSIVGAVILVWMLMRYLGGRTVEPQVEMLVAVWALVLSWAAFYAGPSGTAGSL